MKKLLLLLIALIFLVISCGGSKKADVLPDEDATDADGIEEDADLDDEVNVDEDETDDEEPDEDEDEIEDIDPCEQNPCENLANSDGICSRKERGGFECGCLEGYFWANPGCKKITFANICTGQTKCYDANTLITCPKKVEDFYGQDALYAKLGHCLPQNFSKNESVSTEPTLSDNNLKIEWMKKIADSTYTWDEAVEYCDKLEYAGHNDWRLPFPKELMTLSNHSSYSEENLNVWSAQEFVGSDLYAWYVDNNSGWVWPPEKTQKKYVRCVRGEPLQTHSSTETVYLAGKAIDIDYETSLAWLRQYSYGNWQDALAFCEDLTYAGFSDWRLPNINELYSIVDLAKNRPAALLPGLEQQMKNSMYNYWWNYLYFWSSTTINREKALLAEPIDGSGESRFKSNDYSVTCVRNEPCRKGFYWNGEECVSPCNPNPCGNKDHSDGKCLVEDLEKYSCGCVEGWFWNGEKCVDPCAGIDCGKFEHASGKCKAEDAFVYSCSCDNGYYWRGKNIGCSTQKPSPENICTGQNKCYDNEKEIPCPAEGEEFFGQDANYARLGYCVPQSFSIEETVEGEPVVSDNNTGLKWQKNIPPIKELYYEEVLSYCENLTYGGYNDWRLPSLEEFIIIADFGKYPPLIDTGYFPEYTTAFWTSNNEKICSEHGSGNPAAGGSTYTLCDNQTKVINFTAEPYITSSVTTSSDNEPKKRPFSLNIRCVRGEGSKSEIFTSETYKDLLLTYDKNLIFVKTENLKHTWTEALKYCSELNYAGISDWRVPNIKEYSWNFSTSTHLSTTNTVNAATGYHYLPKEYKSTYTFCVANDPCENGKIWNGEKCTKNPCYGNTVCQSVANSYKICAVIDDENYSCSCHQGYFWNPDKKECLRNCEFNLCDFFLSSDGLCYDDKDEGYRCGCIEGYSWDSGSKRCVNDETSDSDNSGNGE